MACIATFSILIFAAISSSFAASGHVNRKEVFTFFSGNTPPGFYNSLPMENITVIGLFSDHPEKEYPGLMNLAHSSGTKVVKAVSFDDKQVGNSTYRSQWIADNVAAVISLGYDGLNIDYEGNRHGAIAGFTELVIETAAVLRGNLSGAHLSIDAPGYAGFEFRDYDFKSIISVLDTMYAPKHARGKFLPPEFCNLI
jgi:hypothetical protein